MDQGFQDGRFGSPSVSGSGAGYLPQYLLGGNSPASSPLPRGWSAGSSFKSSPMAVSPQSAVRGSAGGYEFSSPLKSAHGKYKVDSSSTRNSPSMGRTPKDVISAPPVEGLYDSRDAATSATPFRWTHDNQQMQTDSPDVFSPGMPPAQRIGSPSTPRNATTSGLDSKLFSPRQGTTSPSPAQIDPFYTQGEAFSSADVLDDCWVTVFGFPPAATPFILQQFAQYGNIRRHVVSTNGNWMHLQFQSKLQAKKALSKNGKVYGSGVMIGVMPCIEKTVMGSCDRENQQMISPNRDEVVKTAPSKLPIRPLTAAYQAASSEHQVVPQDGRMPQKNSNALSKAMEYMFGW